MHGSPIIPEDIHQAGVAAVSYSADNRKIVKFVRRSVHLAHQSDVEGRPIYEARDFVRIQDPGDPLMIIDREVNRDDPYRWPRHWEMYQAGLEQEAVGTPVATLFPANPEIVDMLRALKITTAEQLAGLSEQGIAKLGMGGRKHVQKATDFLEAAKGMAVAGALQMQIDAKDDKIAELERRLDALVNQINEKRHADMTETQREMMGVPERRGPGRPPKHVEA